MQCYNAVEVKNNVAAYKKAHEVTGEGAGRDTPYDKKSSQEKLDFCVHTDRCSLAIFAQILNPLKKAVNIQGVWNDREWKRYFCHMLAVASHSTWNHRCCWMDGTNDSKADHLQAYQEIRDAPETYCASRPSVSRIPVAPGGFLNTGRRGIRQSGAPASGGATLTLPEEQDAEA